MKLSFSEAEILALQVQIDAGKINKTMKDASTQASVNTSKKNQSKIFLILSIE